jgi:HAD superfamily hydrolase (TIGR01484 family)
MMRPLSDFPDDARRQVRVVLADIDDTLTDDGRLPASSLEALEALQVAGRLVVPVTGRPAGWCDHIARMWPVDAVVGENGAFYFSYDRASRKMRAAFAKSAEERAADRKKLSALRDRILAEVPGAGIASDQDYRIADLAIDFREDVPQLPAGSIRRIVGLFEQAGAQAKVSSIHVNGWFGRYDKLTMTDRCLKELFQIDIAQANPTIVFVGDSPNDAPMFAYFENSVGVANVREVDLASPPKWVTPSRSAKGFAELVRCLLESA